jgi:hypothetical protein
MDTHIADDKLKELHVDERTVHANDRTTARYEIDPVAEKKLLRKLDLRVVPVLWFLYMLAFLDRTNIGTFGCSTPCTVSGFRPTSHPQD